MLCNQCGTIDSPKWYKAKTECKSCFNKAYFKANRNKMSELRRTWIGTRSEQDKAYKAHFKANHYETYLKLHKHEEAKRRAKKLKATPKVVIKRRQGSYQRDLHGLSRWLSRRPHHSFTR